jgi:hypothetical protein
MRSVLLLPLLLAVAAPVAGRDLALRQHVTGRGSSVQQYDTVDYLTPTLHITDGPHTRIVIDAKARTATVVDKDARTFWQASFDSLRREVDTIAGNPVGVVDPKLHAPLTLASTGATETIAGHPAVEYSLEGGSPAGSVWLAKDLESPADPALWSDWSGLGARLGPSGKVVDAVLAQKGVPLRTVMKFGGAKVGAVVTTEVTAVREEAPAPELSAIPEGYSRAMRHSFEH